MSERRPAAISGPAPGRAGVLHPDDATTARMPPQARLDVGEHVVALAWSPDGRAVAVAGADGGVYLLEPAADAHVRQLGQHVGGALTVAFATDGEHIASGGQDGTLRVFARGPARDERTVELPETWTGQVTFSPDGRQLAVAAGRRIVLYDARTLSVLHQSAPLPATIEALSFTPDGRQLAAAFYGGVMLQTPFAPFDKRVLPWTGACLALAWRPDASVIVAGGQDASVQFWRLPKDRHAAMGGFATKVRELAWNRSGRWLATGGGCDVTLWDFKTGPEGCTPRNLRYHDEPVVALGWQRRGGWLASVARDRLLLIWDPIRGDSPQAAYRLLSSPTTLAWSPDDRLLAIGGDSGEITFIQPEATAP